MQTTTKLELLDPGVLIPSAGNPRVHTQRQIRELRASLRAYGVVSPVLIDRDRNIITGHAVVEAALAESCGSHRKGCALAKRGKPPARRGVRFPPQGVRFGKAGKPPARRAHKRGRFAPSCESPPPADVTVRPRPQTNLFRLRRENLLCDNVAAVAFCTAAGRRECYRCKVCACRSREGDDLTGASAARHPPQTGCTHFSGGKRQNRLCGSPSASAPRISFAAVPVGSRGAWRPVRRLVPKGKWEIGKREKTAGCLPLARPPRRRDFCCFAKAPSPAVETAHLGGEIKADDYEPCLYGWDARASHRWYGGDGQGTVFFCDKPQESAEHPTMKPVELFARQIRNSTRKGEIVLDPFCGSGTSVLAAETYGRKCRAMELSPHNCDVILARWEQMTGHAAVLLEGGAADGGHATTD